MVAVAHRHAKTTRSPNAHGLLLAAARRFVQARGSAQAKTWAGRTEEQVEELLLHAAVNSSVVEFQCNLAMIVMTPAFPFSVKVPMDERKEVAHKARKDSISQRTKKHH